MLEAREECRANRVQGKRHMHCLLDRSEMQVRGNETL